MSRNRTFTVFFCYFLEVGMSVQCLGAAVGHCGAVIGSEKAADFYFENTPFVETILEKDALLPGHS